MVLPIRENMEWLLSDGLEHFVTVGTVNGSHARGYLTWCSANFGPSRLFDPAPRWSFTYFKGYVVIILRDTEDAALVRMRFPHP